MIWSVRRKNTWVRLLIKMISMALSLFGLFLDMRSPIHFELSTQFGICLFLVYLLHTFSLTRWVLIWIKPYLFITLLLKTIIDKVSFKEINKCWSKHVFVFTFNPYLFYVKTRINNEITIQRKSDTGFLKTLKNIAVRCDGISVINRRTIFESGIGPASIKNLFLVNDLSFYNRKLNILSLFQCYPFESTWQFNMSVIQPFSWQHTQYQMWSQPWFLLLYYQLDIISDSKHRSKTETTLDIIGEQGTEESKFFIDVISKLLWPYDISNESNISNMIGRFNSSIENQILRVCNELQNIDNAKHLKALLP
jgi:hypothetical protein